MKDNEKKEATSAFNKQRQQLDQERANVRKMKAQINNAKDIIKQAQADGNKDPIFLLLLDAITKPTKLAQVIFIGLLLVKI